MNRKFLNKRISIILTCMLIFTLLFNVLSLTSFADKKSSDCVHQWKYESVEAGEKTGKDGTAYQGYYVTRECEECKEVQDNKFVKSVTDSKKLYTASNSWMEKLAVPFGFVIKFFYDLIPVYAIALLFFAVAMKLILFPFGIIQQKNSIKQAKLRPKEMAIRKKYAGRNDKATQQKMQEEIMQLYQKENFNPMSGCLPLLLQMPILFALFRVIYNPLRFTSGVSRDTITAIGRRFIDLGVVYDGKALSASSLRVGDLPLATLLRDKENLELVRDLLPKGFENPDLTFLGIDLSRVPKLELNLLVLIPIATFVVVYFSMYLTRKLTYQPTQTGDAGVSNKIMDLVMPAMSTWFTFMYPAVLGLYWIFQNLLGVLQQLILKKMFPIPVFSEEDYAAAEREMAGKVKKDKKKANVAYKRHPKSLHHIDDDDDDVVAPAKPEVKKEVKERKPESSNPLIDAAPLKDDKNDN